MFKREDILKLMAEVETLEQRINAEDIGHVQMGDDEDDVVSQADRIIAEINEGLDKQKGLTPALFIALSGKFVADFNEAHGTKLSQEDLLANKDNIIDSVNKNLDDEAKDAECLLSGFIDAVSYLKAARLYADAGRADKARTALKGVRYLLPRILDRGTN
jgi:hypothetical protein